MNYSLDGQQPEFDGDAHFVAPDATLIGKVRLRDRASVWFGSVLRGDCEWIEVGPGSNIQDGCVLHTDPGFPLTIGKGVTVGHRVMLHGCTVGDHSLIGIGSTILNGASIGKHCLVGAHALVTEGKTFADGSLILGAPAKRVRDLTAEEIAGLRESASHYVDNAARYATSLRGA